MYSFFHKSRHVFLHSQIDFVTNLISIANDEHIEILWSINFLSIFLAAEMIPKLKTRQTNQQLPNSQPLNAVTEKQKKRKK